MAKKINYLVLSYPEFVRGAIIDPDEANQNNADIANKVNEFVDEVEEAILIAENAELKATSAEGKANEAIDVANTKGNQAINTATTLGNQAIDIANTATNTANSAVSTANSAVDVANQAQVIATDVQTSYETLKPELEDAIEEATSTVQHIQEIIEGTVFNRVGGTTNFGKFIALQDDVVSFSLPSTIYNPLYDVLTLVYRGVELNEGENYTKSGRTVNLAFSLKNGEDINYRISKNILIDPTLSDGAFLKNGSVHKVKLDAELIAEIENKAGFDDLDSVVEELDRHLADYVSQLSEFQQLRADVDMLIMSSL